MKTLVSLRLDHLLFHQKRQSPLSGPSPDAPFSPVAALAGAAFSDALAPSAKRYPNTLIITAETGEDLDTMLACRYLANKRFDEVDPLPVFKWVQTSHGKTLAPFNPDEWEKTADLAVFDPETDHRVLAEHHGLSFDHTVVLQGECLDEILFVLHTDFSRSRPYQSHCFYHYDDDGGDFWFNLLTKWPEDHQPRMWPNNSWYKSKAFLEQTFQKHGQNIGRMQRKFKVIILEYPSILPSVIRGMLHRKINIIGFLKMVVQSKKLNPHLLWTRWAASVMDQSRTPTFAENEISRSFTYWMNGLPATERIQEYLPYFPRSTLRLSVSTRAYYLNKEALRLIKFTCQIKPHLPQLSYFERQISDDLPRYLGNDGLTWIPLAPEAATKSGEPGMIYGASSGDIRVPSVITSDPSTTPEKTNMDFYPLFSCVNERDRTDRLLQEKMRQCLRMATAAYFSLHDRTLIEEPLSELTALSPSATEERVVYLDCIGLMHLQPIKEKPNAYYVPVLSVTQTLVSIEGGELYYTALGQWVLLTPIITACRLVIAVSRACRVEEEWIDASRVHASLYDDIPGIASLRDFLSEDLGDMRCSDRVTLFLQRYRPTSAKYFYTSNGGAHAFLSVCHGEKLIKVDLGGGGVAKKIYRHAPQEMLTDSAAAAGAGTGAGAAARTDVDANLSAATGTSDDSTALLTSPHYSLTDLLCYPAVLVQDADTLSYIPALLRAYAPTDCVFTSLSFAACQLTQRNFYAGERDIATLDTRDTALATFFKRANEVPAERFFWIVDFSALTPAQRVRLHEIIDARPANVQLLALIDKPSNDPSVDRRFDKIIEDSSLSLPPVVNEATLPSSHPPVILWQHRDWETALFGPLVMTVDNEVMWQRTPTVDLLERGEGLVTLSGIARESINDAKKIIALAMHTRELLYHGHRIVLSPHIALTVDEQAVDFSLFTVCVKQNVLLNEIPSDAIIINTDLFYSVISRKKISEGHYETLPGWIEEGRSLYVTGDLSDEQWYAMAKQAETVGRRLRLYLAPGVSLPTFTQAAMEDVASPLSECTLPTIIVTPHADAYVRERAYRKAPNTLVLSVEDISFQSLLYAIEVNVHEGRFANFRVRESELVEGLSSPEWHIVLKGRFSRALLHYLHRVLARGVMEINDKMLPITARLTCIAEGDKSLLRELAWLGPRLSFEPALLAPFHAPIIKESELGFYRDDDLSESTHDLFFSTRKAQALTMMHHHRIVQWVSETGRGKTSLMKALQADGIVVYTGLDQLRAWAAHTGDEPFVVWFGDEINCLDQHFTALLDDPMLIDGQLYSIAPNKKIVLAKNPMNHGGGRLDQALFLDHPIPTFEFTDFPAASIYHLLLAPLYHEAFLFSRDEFEAMAYREIARYRSTETTVRRLQYALMSACVEAQEKKLTEKHACGFFSPVTERAAPLSLESQRNAHKALTRFLDIDRYQKMGYFPKQIGLAAFLLMGPSGVGKTTLIKQVTQSAHAVVLTASDPELMKKLIGAIASGCLVQLDEIDTLSSDNEEMLIILLNGDHPHTRLPMENPGKLIISINGAALPGRAALSRALCERAVCETLSHPTVGDIAGLLERYRPDIAPGNRAHISERYARLFRTDQRFTLQAVITPTPSGSGHKSFR